MRPSPFATPVCRCRQYPVDVVARFFSSGNSIVQPQSCRRSEKSGAVQWGQVDKRRMCPNCRAFVTTSDRVCPYCEVSLGTRPVDRRNPGEILGGLIPQARFTTVMILLINTALFLAQYVSPESGLMQWGASIPAPLMHGQWWRLITAGFLHGGIFHILMNSWVLFDLGAEVELLYGTSRLIVFYFVSTVTGFWTSSHLGFHSSVGSSAGIFGLIGAMLAFG